MSDIFISYKKEDKSFVSQLAEKLTDLGWSIWWDNDIPAGKNYYSVIDEELSNSKCVIVLWTKSSIISDPVIAEATEAHANNTYLPVIIGNIKPPILFRPIQGIVWNDINKLEENKFNELVKHIKRFLGEPHKMDSPKENIKIPETRETKTVTKASESLSVKIGSQVWMKENLNVERFRNGDVIPEVKDESEWKKAGKNKQPAWCYYDNNPANGKIYGKLYNWYAVNDPRGLAPEGWHIPSDQDWTALTDYLGGNDAAGGKMKSTGTQYWESPNTCATNESEFSGLPGGFRYGNGVFNYVGINGFWWSSTEHLTYNAWARSLLYEGGNVGRSLNYEGSGFSVRCLRD